MSETMADHLDTITHHAQAAREHTTARDQAIIAAYRTGHSISAIARAAGMTRQGIQPIVRRDTMTITDRDIRQQVTESLTEHIDSHNIDGIVRDIVGRFGLVDIDSIDHDEYWEIVANNARGGA